MTKDEAAMLARIDERTQSIMERLPHFASCESVEAISDRVTVTEKNISKHIDEHAEMNVNRWTIGGSFLSSLVAIGIAIFKR